MEFDISDEVVNDKELLILKNLIRLYMSHFNEWFMAMGRIWEIYFSIWKRTKVGQM